MNLDFINLNEILKNQKAAESKFTHLTTDEWKYLRHRAKTDLFFLAHGVLGFKKLSVNLHGNLCAWHRLTNGYRFREILLPRAHYKSSIETIADSVQIILPDDSGLEPWPRNLGPDCRLLIVHEIIDQASRFLSGIAGHFLENPTLMGLFPECVPDVRKQKINKYELELPRRELWVEPTIDTMGVGGRSQGKHYNYIKADDLIGDKARDSATEMQRAKDWFDNIQSFFSSFKQDHLDVIGTRWAFDDLYAHIHKVYGDDIKKYIRAVEELNEEGERVPIFPEEFDLNQLRILRKNRKVWSAQYINDPKESATSFDHSWKRFYERPSFHTVRVPTAQGFIDHKVHDLDTIILYDPAVHGNCGFVVTGTDQKNLVYILDAVKATWKPPEAIDYLFKAVVKYHPRVVAIESVNFSALYQNWLPREMQMRHIHFKVIPVQTKQKKKTERIEGLSPYFSAGVIHFHESQEDLIEEFDTFGASDDIHILDALAYGPELWRPALSKERWEKFKQAEEEMLNERDISTGYSS